MIGFGNDGGNDSGIRKSRSMNGFVSGSRGGLIMTGVEGKEGGREGEKRDEGTAADDGSPITSIPSVDVHNGSKFSLSQSKDIRLTGQLGNLVGDDGYYGSDDSDDDSDDERYNEYPSDHMTMRAVNTNRIHKRKSSECLRMGSRVSKGNDRIRGGLRRKSGGEVGSGVGTGVGTESATATVAVTAISNNASLTTADTHINHPVIRHFIKSLVEYIPQGIPGVSILNKLIADLDGNKDTSKTTTDESETEVEQFVTEPQTPPPTLFYGNNNIDIMKSKSQMESQLQTQLQPYVQLKPLDKASLIRSLQSQQETAQSYPHWLEISRQLDSLLENNDWKLEDESDLYDSDLVRHRLEQLRSARETGDTESLLFLIRTTLQRNLGNMGDPHLYQYSYTGTKRLIEDYISECELCLQTLMASPKIDDTRLLGTLIQTRKAFGRTALVLSGGSTFGVLHIGVLFELLSAKLLPRVISGSSAGSIFASILCIHLDEELDSLLQLLEGNFDIFEKTGSEESTLVRITRFLKYGTWFDNKYLSSTLRSILGDLTFQEAYYRTRRVLNVSVSPSSVHEMPKLLNYLTAPNVLIWSAVCASCSAPLVFASFDILAKNPKTGEHYSWSPSTFIDGSVDNDLPLARLSEMFNINHFIACQVNPHVAPFLKISEAISGTNNIDKSSSSLARSIVSRWSDIWTFTQDIISDEISHFLLILGELGIFKNTSTKFRSVLAQQYSGDITILPQIKWSELGLLFKNPSPEFFHKTKTRAARATWQKMSIIRNHCAIELALDRAILEIRSRLIPHPFAFSEQSATAGRQTRMYHYRRKSEIVLHKALLRKNSWQDVGSKKYWSPSPPFLSAHSSHVSLYSLNPSQSSAVARYKDSTHLQP